MNITALLTSAGINIALCVVFFSLYSILRKQPSNISTYFGQRLDQLHSKGEVHFSFDRLIPSASWIVKAWEASEDEIFACGGIDAVVFLRIVIFSIRIFSIAAIICIFLVLPLNYYGQETRQKPVSSEMDVFTIAHVKEGSRWLWAHCLALYVITSCACVLLYFEYKTIAKMRMVHITGSPSRPSHFTVLLRAIPWSSGESYSTLVKKYFTNYYASSYLSHQMVYQSGTVQKLMGDAEKMYKMIKSTPVKQYCGPSLIRCGLCGVTANSFKMLPDDPEIDVGRSNFDGGLDLRDKECEAALVFFRTRYAALIAGHAVQSPDPMLWITEPAPEPDDVFWSNLCVPYRLLWIRRISTFMASIVFMLLFLGPTTFVQGLTYLEKLQNTFPFLRGVQNRKFVSLITGYLPSVVLMLFLYIVPPLMLLFATLEGSISRSSRKRSACIKVLYFLIWNVFLANILSGSYMDRLGAFTTTSPKELANSLAAAVPASGELSLMAYFFMTYIMTSGWTSLSFELMQPFVLLCNMFNKYVRKKDGFEPYTFPYHTEVPRVLLLGLLGFTFSVLAPLILPFLLIYFLLAYFVYRNQKSTLQILNVYITRYQTGGLYWPIAHNVVIFSLVLTQIIAATIFGMKRSSVASSFIVPLIICTLLFNMYCRQKFLPLFKNNAAQVLVEMDREDERSGRMEEILQKVRSAYCQFGSVANTPSTAVILDQVDKFDDEKLSDPEDQNPAKNKEQDNGKSPENSSWEICEMNQTVPVSVKYAAIDSERMHGALAELVHEKNQSVPPNLALTINERAHGPVRLEIQKKNRSVHANFAQMFGELARRQAAEQPRLEFHDKNRT